MIETYSKRLLSPYIGLVQIAETPKARARALSLDGRNWAIQYSLQGLSKDQKAHGGFTPESQYALVAGIEHGRLVRHALHPFLDPDAVTTAIDALAETVAGRPLPFPAVDRFECWLLDGIDERPLALLHSCASEEEKTLYRARPAWIAMPAAQLEIESGDRERQHYVPPVNYRLQKLIEERAGPRPRTLWVDRGGVQSDDFPPCLIAEHWEDEGHHLLCQQYIRRLAPRLLMLQGLPRTVRGRLERAAREHVFDVERFHALYPEVLDRELMAASRVEARMRRAAQGRGG